MPDTNNPPCPRCARLDSKQVSSSLVYRLSDRERLNPVARTTVYQCECGLGFTHDTPLAPAEIQPHATDTAKAWLLRAERSV